MTHRVRGIRLALRMLLAPTVLACFSSAALADVDIQGVARNLSRGEPAAGDAVTLLRLDQGLREEARSQTDRDGRFAFHLQYPEKSLMVRVIHQGVDYDQQVPAGGLVRVNVFDAAPAVRHITGSIEILRVGAKGTLLHVSDMYEIENESRPPLTRTGTRTFEVYLPPDARIDSVLVASPEKTVKMLPASPAPGEPGHYCVNFPLQPGATRFAFNYDLSYQGHAAFRIRRIYPVKQFAVMIPPSMRFSSRSALFKILPAADANYRVYAANQLRAGIGPGFEIAGSGPPHPIGDQPKSQAGSQAADSFAPKALGPLASQTSFPRIDSALGQVKMPSQSHVLAGITAILLVVCVLLVWRARHRPS